MHKSSYMDNLERTTMNTMKKMTGKRQHPLLVSDPSDVIDITDDGEVTPLQVRNPVTHSRPLRERGPTPLQQVLHVFPYVERAHVNKMLDYYGNNVEVVVSQLATNSHSYPIISDLKPAPSGAPFVFQERVAKKWSFDFMSASSFEPHGHYLEQARIQLLIDFPYLSEAGAAALLVKAKQHYAIAHDSILQLVKGKGGPQEQYTQVQSGTFPTSVIGKKIPSAYVMRTAREKSEIHHTSILDEIFKEECEYVQNRLSEWLRETSKELLRLNRKEVCDREGTGVDCLCCCDLYPIEDMIQCSDEGHLFCCNCLRQQMETLVFGNGNLGVDRRAEKPATDLLCFHGDCTSKFSRGCLEKAVPDKSLEKYDRVQFAISVKQAGIENMAICPNCNYQVALSSSDQRILKCPIANCFYESCVLCGDASHIPLRCEEVEKQKKDKNETSDRLIVEEAMSAAKIRNCPNGKCDNRFEKNDGCNKMECPCGAKFCYVCRLLITDPAPYNHFCQKTHCDHKRCKKCPLNTNDREDEVRAMRESGEQAARRLRRESTHEASIVDVNALMNPRRQRR